MNGKYQHPVNEGELGCQRRFCARKQVIDFGQFRWALSHPLKAFLNVLPLAGFHPIILF